MIDPPTKDSNGNILADGDSVTLIKDLKVKGSGGVTLKRGTLVTSSVIGPGPAVLRDRLAQAPPPYSVARAGPLRELACSSPTPTVSCASPAR